MATYAARFRLGCWSFCSPASEKTWTCDDNRPSHRFEWDKLALRMISEFIFSQHPVFKCSNILQTGVLLKRKKGGRAGTHFNNEPENHLILVNMILACTVFFAMKNWIQNTMPISIENSILELNQEEHTASAPQKIKVPTGTGVICRSKRPADADGTGPICRRENCRRWWNWCGLRAQDLQVLLVRRQRGQSCLCEDLAKYC